MSRLQLVSRDLEFPSVFFELTRHVIGCAMEVHRILGPGLLEATYAECFSYELSSARLPFRSEEFLPISYKGTLLSTSYRADFIVDDCLIVELKAVESLGQLHAAQILTYMKIVEAPVGLLINFNPRLLKQGIKRFAMSRFQGA